MGDIDDLFDSPFVPVIVNEKSGTVEIVPANTLTPKLETPAITALRESLGLEQCANTPFIHQVVGINALVTHPYFALFDEMGAGKSFQTIVAACILYLRGEIDRMVLLAPSPVRAVWYDELLGELKKHLWDIPAVIAEFHSSTRAWEHGTRSPVQKTRKPFEIIITNYELLRQTNWLRELVPYVQRRTFLVCDESSAIKNWKAEQTKSVRLLRKRVIHFTLLNGTPIADNPLDMFSQGNLLHPSILECPFITHYKARYATMGGYLAEIIVGRNPATGQPIIKKVPTQIVGWKNLPDLQQRFAPHVLRRLKVDCLDLPPKLPPVTATIPMKEKTWAHYRAMRDDMVTWLNETSVAVANQAMTKAMRLAQITSGFVGGIESIEDVEVDMDEADNGLGLLPFRVVEPGGRIAPKEVQEISREKLDWLIDWTELALENDPHLKLLIWCRFKPEVLRCVDAFRQHFKAMDVSCFRGGQKKAEEIEAMKLLDPRFAPAGAATVFSTSKGSMGFTLTASHTIVRMSRDYSLFKWLQSDDRVHRPGQTSPISYTDAVAVGPKGQKTVDHIIYQALLAKLDVSTWTTSAWVRALTDVA